MRGSSARYFSEIDPDKAWGAYEVIREWGDKRFDSWRESIEKLDGADAEFRMGFVKSAWQSRKNAFDRRDKRNENYLGLGITRGQVFPFISF